MISLRVFAFILLSSILIQSIKSEHLGYDEDLAQELVLYSFSTHCPPARLYAWDIPIVSERYPKWEDITVLTTQNHQMLAGYNFRRNAITFVFRGSSNLANWIANINAIKSKFDPCNCQVHAGFHNDYKELKAGGLLSIYQSLRAKHPNAELYVTGHSLGGALATLMTAELHSIGARTNVLITFGSPRVGDTNFYPWFEQYVHNNGFQYFRITHGDDPVPHLPPQTWGFNHIDTEVFYNETPTVCKDGQNEDPNCSFGQNYSILRFTRHNNYIYIDNSSIENNCK